MAAQPMVGHGWRNVKGCRPASSSRAGAAPPARTPIAPAFLSAPPSAV